MALRSVREAVKLLKIYHIRNTTHLVTFSKATKAFQGPYEAVHSKLCPLGMLCALCLTAESCHSVVIPGLLRQSHVLA